jgi:hypothetical protein
MTSRKRSGGGLIVFGLVLALGPVPSRARAPQAPQNDTGGLHEVHFAATSAHVSQPGSPISIRILRWSTEEERTPVVAALSPAPPVAAPGLGSGPDSGRGTAGLPAGAGGNPPAAAGRAGGRGGRGGRGARGDSSVPVTPIGALTAAIGRAPTLGYIWTNDVTGYSIKYAYRLSLPDGGERIILATNRRLGAHVPAWTPAVTEEVTDYEFTLIEIRLDSKGLGEGKTSLTTKVVLDNSAKTVALENYAAAPAILQNVKRSS